MAWLLVLLIVGPLVELYLIIQVSHVIGGWETIALLVVEGVIGAWLLKRQGLSTMARISQALGAGRVPDRELVDGLLIVVAGSLMLAPGFIGDVVGYLLLLPPTRAPVRSLLLRRFRQGRHGRLLAAFGEGGGGRFVGTFKAGPTFDATGREAPPRGPSGGPGRLEP